MISSEVEKTTKRIAGTDGLQDRKFCIYIIRKGLLQSRPGDLSGAVDCETGNVRMMRMHIGSSEIASWTAKLYDAGNNRDASGLLPLVGEPGAVKQRGSR